MGKVSREILESFPRKKIETLEKKKVVSDMSFGSYHLDILSSNIDEQLYANFDTVKVMKLNAHRF